MSQTNILVPLLEGFEEIEAVTIIDVLRRGELSVTVAGDTAGPVRGAHNISISADVALEDVEADQFDMMILPGGMPGSSNLAKHRRVQSLLSDVAAAGKLTGAICAAPIALAAAGLHKGKSYTCYPGFQHNIEGGEYVNERVVIDDKLITGCGPGAAIEFALAIVRMVRGDEVADRLSAGMLVA